METRKNNNSKTKQYKIQPSRKTKHRKDDTIIVNAKGEKVTNKTKKKKKHSKLKKAILIIFDFGGIIPICIPY